MVTVPRPCETDQLCTAKPELLGDSSRLLVVRRIV